MGDHYTSRYAAGPGCYSWIFDGLYRSSEARKSDILIKEYRIDQYVSFVEIR